MARRATGLAVMLTYARLRIVAVFLAFLVGWLGSLFVSAVFEWDPHSMSSTAVRCPHRGKTIAGRCEPDEQLYRIVGMPWPPVKAYALGSGVLGGLAVLALTRKSKVRPNEMGSMVSDDANDLPT